MWNKVEIIVFMFDNRNLNHPGPIVDPIAIQNGRENVNREITKCNVVSW